MVQFQVDMSLADQVYNTLRTDIITCALEPGQQVVQSQLAERYQFGVTPIREALQRLTQEGFVRPIPRFGYIVSPITVSDVHELYELRAIVESAAARLAATRGSQEQLNRIAEEADFRYVFGDRQSYMEFLTRNADFHRSVAIAADNQRLADLISKLLDEMTRIFHLGLDLKDSAGEMRNEHIALAKALCDRDPDRAAQIVLNQIVRSEERVLEALTHRDGGGLSKALGEAVQVRLREL
jgi:DNA-binding GntR family transcriptional regulator